MGVELVHVPYLTEGPPHFLHHLHVFERCPECFGGGLHRLHRRITSRLGRDSCVLTSRPCRLRGCARFLCQLSELFCVGPGRLRGTAMCFCGLPVLFGVLADLFRHLAQVFSVLSLLLWRNGVVGHVDTSLPECDLPVAAGLPFQTDHNERDLARHDRPVESEQRR